MYRVNTIPNKILKNLSFTWKNKYVRKLTKEKRKKKMMKGNLLINNNETSVVSHKI